MEFNFTPQHKNPLFYWKCKQYAAVGYIFLKGYFKTIKDKKCMVKMKSHIFKEDGIHYYLEVSIGEHKFIIDNFSCIYGYNEYKNRFKPKQIETIQVREIKMIEQSILTLNKHLYDCIIADIKTYIEEPKIYDVFGTKMYTETFYNFGKDKHVENKM